MILFVAQPREASSILLAPCEDPRWSLPIPYSSDHAERATSNKPERLDVGGADQQGRLRRGAPPLDGPAYVRESPLLFAKTHQGDAAQRESEESDWTKRR